ncbi:hypothetical protein KIH41_14385 [Litoribacter ruber]|uniref:Uncharacterized protein n=1 Tax=Litoribacter ruber TaxID=702568 RepID=A0AAP2G126_9BACT|nr:MULTISPECIES: hypothetical protein [Litoribacter]MBS9523402.1 hypothetical protein [Litoribacter alkaliphilus]MBT0812472.1 hypothetical protein [Litoribacter ruber]
MSKDKSFDPELIKLFKIFGIGTLIWVFALSFFNTKTVELEEGEIRTSITAASRLYFMNVRQPFYDRENRNDAKMNVFRLSKRVVDDSRPVINLSIILNRVKEDAYIYLEPSEAILDGRINLKYSFDESDSSGIIQFGGGDRFDHFRFVDQVYPLLLQDAHFEIETSDGWEPILVERKERDAFKTTSFDYFRLLEQEDRNK